MRIITISASQKVCLELLLERSLRLDELISKISTKVTVGTLKSDLENLVQQGLVVRKRQKDLYILSKEGKAVLDVKKE